MLKKLLLAACLMPAAAFADSAMDRGHNLEQASCTACHASMSGGNATRIYTRPDRRIKSLEQLEKRVKGCAAANGVTWTPEEEKDVVTYLNGSFYKFK